MTAWLRRIFEPRALRLARDKRRLGEAARLAGCSRKQSKTLVSIYFGNHVEID
ncbi:hypothetical protein [Polaromonas sp.]|uniref:hypothetical protein n=1 Tax=Polaromonas sp. TaxID=1869339 RepID=UPI0032639E52